MVVGSTRTAAGLVGEASAGHIASSEAAEQIELQRFV